MQGHRGSRLGDRRAGSRRARAHAVRAAGKLKLLGSRDARCVAFSFFSLSLRVSSRLVLLLTPALSFVVIVPLPKLDAGPQSRLLVCAASLRELQVFGLAVRVRAAAWVDVPHDDGTGDGDGDAGAEGAAGSGGGGESGQHREFLQSTMALEQVAQQDALDDGAGGGPASRKTSFSDRARALLGGRRTSNGSNKDMSRSSQTAGMATDSF